ncbi:hypothetical protein L6452_18124 [Arctium lappa]|uniref:Uncharacterized protein n=1 Tax=Arctium lappa TaxID=4217 RepID=A0ACB9C5A6_ARCLA|nr:hypothetical protein L6452_18124 [Arctium lappa]
MLHNHVGAVISEREQQIIGLLDNIGKIESGFALMSELEGLRQEYQHCRATYEFEKKFYNDHLESLQVMEKNYMSMASEVEKLREESKKHVEIDKRTVGPYAGFVGYNDKEAYGHYLVGQNFDQRLFK